MAHRKHHGHKKHRGGCTPTRISFRTRRGKSVAFTARPGGDAANGGACPAHKKHGNPEFTRAARACGRSVKAHGKAKFRAMATCVKHAMR